MPAALDSMLDAVSEAQKRVRLAMVIALLASGTIIVAEWNSYFSWDRQWADVNPTQPKKWGQQKVLESQIASWQESNAVNVSLLGLRISVNDAPAIGSVILLIAAFYVSLCIRAENLEVGTLLHQVKDHDPDQRRHVFNRIRSGMVFYHADVSAQPFETLDQPPTQQERTPFVGFVLRLILFLPAVAVAVALASDIYFASTYTDSWQHLEQKYRYQLYASDTFALVSLILIVIFQVRAWKYWRGTRKIMDAFESLK